MSVQKITSINNELIKNTAKLLQKKYREESGLFLLEGEKCIEEAFAYGIKIKHLFVQTGYDKFSDVEHIEVTETVMSKISDAKSAPKCVAVAEQVKPEWQGNKYNRVVLLDSIKDAGNLGTIIRTCCAFGVDAIIMYGDAVDLYNPKCVRSTVGNLWKIPEFNVKSFKELKNMCKEFTPVATLPKSNNTILLKNYSASSKSLIMFGSEADGLCDELKSYAEEFGVNLTVEMDSNVESLNLSISAGVILHHLYA